MLHAADHFFDMIDVSGDGNLDPSELHPLFFPPTLPVPLPTLASPPSCQIPRALPVSQPWHSCLPSASACTDRLPRPRRIGSPPERYLPLTADGAGSTWLGHIRPGPCDRWLLAIEAFFLQHSVAQQNYDEFMKCADSNGVGR